MIGFVAHQILAQARDLKGCARDIPTQSWAVLAELSGQLTPGERILCAVAKQKLATWPETSPGPYPHIGTQING